MPSSPDRADEPLLEVIEDLASASLHAAAWATCAGPGWCFGHGSTSDAPGRFWQMDLTGDGAFDAIWEQARPRCESMAGIRLRVIRQYANGHTYGQGGAAHADDDRPGTFTLLYYANPEWQEAWEGETVYYDPNGEVALAVRPRPNRAVFFDSRIPHAGRAPGRACPGLRVTVAYKLEAAGLLSSATASPVAAPPPSPSPVQSHASPRPPGIEATSDGPHRTMRVRVEPGTIEPAVSERLAALSRTVRLPGHLPGQIPPKLMHERYGAKARHDVLRGIAVDLIERELLPNGTVPASFALAEQDDGGAELQITATHLPDLVWDDMTAWRFDRLSPPAVLDPAPAADAGPMLHARLNQDILSQLDRSAPVPVLPSLVERELASMLRLAEEHGQAGLPGDEWATLLRPIAERRLRVGYLIVELARRFGLKLPPGPHMEAEILGRILAIAQVTDRAATAAEWAELTQ